MSVSSSEDPVKTILDIIDGNTADSDWGNAGSKPTIERMEAKEVQIKLGRQGDYVYVWSPDAGEEARQGAAYDRFIERQIIQCDCWTTVDQDRSNELARDVRSIVRGFSNSNKGSTQWTEIVPQQTNDYRHESRANFRGDQWIETVQVMLMATRPT